jgi:CDP-glucose 4,6-dehydratase
VRGDVRDLARLRETMVIHRPAVVFHLAAQPLVLPSYRQPKETFDVNVGGTVNVLEAVRTTGSVRAVVCVTTDKVYKNQGWLWGYRENDELGGHDPYSASKAMAELAVSAYRQSFFPAERYQEHGVAVATARAGNVFGGGDWGETRLVPDCVRALVAGAPIALRNPGYVRPWQLQLESLSGYLWLGTRLLGADGILFADAWNIGPSESQGIAAEQVVQKAIQLWGAGSFTRGVTQEAVETEMLRLNSDKAAHRLGWRAIYGWEEALSETMSWYKTYQAAKERVGIVDMYRACVDQIARYTDRASAAGLAWAAGAADG